MTGVITEIHQGYAFIVSDPDEDNSTERIFLYHSGLQATTLPFRDLKIGMHAEFTRIDSPHGPRAIECRVWG